MKIELTRITTNLTFDKWHDIFQDSLMIVARIDHLMHQSFVINMNGDCYKLTQTIKMVN